LGADPRWGGGGGDRLVRGFLSNGGRNVSRGETWGRLWLAPGRDRLLREVPKVGNTGKVFPGDPFSGRGGGPQGRPLAGGGGGRAKPKWAQVLTFVCVW